LSAEIPHLDKRVGKDGKVQKAEKTVISAKPIKEIKEVNEEFEKPLKASEIANIILNSNFDFFDLRKIALTSLEECLKLCDKSEKTKIAKEVKYLIKRFGG